MIELEGMTHRTKHIGAAAVLVVFLLGFVPQYGRRGRFGAKRRRPSADRVAPMEVETLLSCET